MEFAKTVNTMLTLVSEHASLFIASETFVLRFFLLFFSGSFPFGLVLYSLISFSSRKVGILFNLDFFWFLFLFD